MKNKARLSSHRAGHCAQHYHLIRLDWMEPTHDNKGSVQFKLRSTNFDLVNAQFFVRDSLSAQIMVTDHEHISRGTWAQETMGIPSNVRLVAVAYSITACAKGKTLESEDFIHKFKGGVWLHDWQIRSVKGKLWTWRPLNQLLEKKVFGDVKGAQFLA